eukprot:961078-Alexandrium_andersonii.AAC.1
MGLRSGARATRDQSMISMCQPSANPQARGTRKRELGPLRRGGVPAARAPQTRGRARSSMCQP